MIRGRPVSYISKVPNHTEIFNNIHILFFSYSFVFINCKKILFLKLSNINLKVLSWSFVEIFDYTYKL